MLLLGVYRIVASYFSCNHTAADELVYNKLSLPSPRFSHLSFLPLQADLSPTNLLSQGQTQLRLTMSAATTTTPSNYAAIWNLNPQSIAIPKTESSFPLGARGVESVIGKDNRKPVPSPDYIDGGQYRGNIPFLLSLCGCD
jgi:hypothetical protein